MTSVAVGEVQIDDRGVAFVGRTRMKVSQIVTERHTWGLTAEEIAENHDTITLSEVFTALAYYADHRQQVDAELAEAEAFVEQLRAESQQPDDLSGQLEARKQGRS